ncbi:MAG: AIPR family protein [Xanthobacteraceae bacterium]
MPNAAEKIAHIEAALRRRFFPLVPERTQKWTADQHEIDRCSRSLAAYALCGMCGIADATAAGALVDGGDDGGIDALHFDCAKQRLIVIQSKYKRPNNAENPQGTGPNQAETLKFINGTKALMERRFDGFNAAVRNRLDEIEEALDTPGVKICLILPFLGEALDTHAKADLDAFVAQCNSLSDCMSATVVGITQTYDWMVAEQANQAVDVRLTLEKWSSVTAPRKAIYGLVKGQDLAALVTEHGTALFERNIRHYLGSVGVNVAIEETVRRRPEDFFYLNNGITAVTSAIAQAPGSPDRCVFGLTAFSIVNGAQTAGSITTASLAAAISENAKLHITIIEVPDPADDFAVRVTRARNYQNQVRGVDFAALDPNQERIRQELAAVGIRYHYRPSAESRIRQDDAFTLEEAALALACLAFAVTDGQRRGHRGPNAVDFVVIAKREIGRLWEQDGAIYSQLFPASISGVRICRLVRIYQFIDRILAGSERAETAYDRRMFFRHGRYFIMAFVAHRLPKLVGKAQRPFSPPRRKRDIAGDQSPLEVIFATSKAMQVDRGFLAIFRNLTDAQPLAEKVLLRLAELDAAQNTPAPASAAAPAIAAAATDQP